MQRCRIYMPFGISLALTFQWTSFSPNDGWWWMAQPTIMYLYISGTLEHEFDIQDNRKTQIVFFPSHPWEKFPKPRATKKEPHARNHIEKRLKWRKIERPSSCRWWPNDDWTYSGFSRPSQCLSSSLPGRANPWLPIFQARFVQREVVTQKLELKWDIPPQSVYSIK